ncbi:MAG TPA: flagellar biosynthesis protein FlhB [Syntrophales bacterium]|nr:flagellar biosynthesis protein FlhB [Syntrophales bacterium]
MAEEDQGQERTEQATPKRRDEAREKGQVAVSREVASAIVLGASLIYFYFGSGRLMEGIVEIMKATFRDAGRVVLSQANFHALMLTLVYKVFLLIFPLLLAVFIAGFLANVLQVGFMFSWEAVQPKLSKIDPFKGFKRLFSLRSLVELVKGLFKISVVGLIAYLVIIHEIPALFPLADQSIWGMLVFIGRVAFKIMMLTCFVLLVMALLDYLYQRWEFEKSIRMSRQEIKDEFKHTEGDPLIKSRIKRLQRDIARKRMMAGIPKADVIITNPTHLAIAIRYDQENMNAPVVVAKGAGHVAEKIKEIAAEHKIPVVENKPVAQVLYKIANIGDMIPADLYRAVAEILAYVYRLKEKSAMA